MNAPKVPTVTDALNAIDTRRDGLARLREPFPPNQISKLPKETKKQAEERKAGNNIEWKCDVCGGMHHKNAVHLDYVGHAALTDRLLEVDPEWSWEPMGRTAEGLPMLSGGLWIKLTVCGVSRYGFGAADGKAGGDAVKEMIGDALRNAAMRFGAALDLWHKGDLHVDVDAGSNGNGSGETRDPGYITQDQEDDLRALATELGADIPRFCNYFGVESLSTIPADRFDAALEAMKAKKRGNGSQLRDQLQRSLEVAK